jgi:hypothetical protein
MQDLAYASEHVESILRAIGMTICGIGLDIRVFCPREKGVRYIIQYVLPFESHRVATPNSHTE